MAFYANLGLQARQDTRSTGRATRLTSSSSSRSTSPTVTRLTSTSTTSTSVSTTSSSSLVAPSSTFQNFQTPKVITTTSQKPDIVFPTASSSISSLSKAVPTAAAAVTTTRKGSLAGAIVGIIVGIAVVIIIGAFILRRLRKRRKRLDEAHFFNKDEFDRSGMVQGLGAGPGVTFPNGIENEKDSFTIQKTLPQQPYPFAPQQRGFTDIPTSPYGTGDPFSPVPSSGSPYNFNASQQEFGAPPIPGSSGAAPYSPYMATFSKHARGNQTTPPGSPFRGNPMQNPFATPSATDTQPSTPSSAAAWTHNAMGTYHLPLLPKGAFADDSYRDSGYSAAYSEVHVGQAYKVQVGHSLPKYADLTTATVTADAPGNPPPLIPLDPAATVNTADPANTSPVATVDNITSTPKALPPRPLSSLTVYNPEDAYGGV